MSQQQRQTESQSVVQKKDSKQRQLEDLNETLQRLAREKYAASATGGKTIQQSAANQVAQAHQMKKKTKDSGVSPHLAYIK